MMVGRTVRHAGYPCDVAKRQSLGAACGKNLLGRVEQAGPQISVVVSAGGRARNARGLAAGLFRCHRWFHDEILTREGSIRRIKILLL